MAEFRISRLRYTWLGTWAAGTVYQRDDVVRFGAKSYVCIRAHTANASFYFDLNFVAPGETSPSPAWVIMTDGYAFRGAWAANTAYNLSDIVYYGGTLYVCNTPYTSGSIFDTNIANWDVYIKGTNWRNIWLPNTRYGIGDLVRYGAKVYKCRIGHTSSNTTNGLELDLDQGDSSASKWEETYYEGLDYKGNWTQNTRYKFNDVVKYGATLFKCDVYHTSTTTFDSTKFSVEIPGYQYIGEWSSLVNYAVGDIVKNGGNLYVAKFNNINSSPINSIYQIGTMIPVWELLNKGYNFAGDWESGIIYKTGDVVRRGGQLWVALLDTVSDGSTIDYIDTSNWELIVPGDKFAGPWYINTEYQFGDLVQFYGSLYRCNYAHVSSDQNYPGDNGSGFNYWDIVIEVATPTGMSQVGDLLTYDLSNFAKGDLSTLGPTSIPIGTPGQVLEVEPGIPNPAFPPVSYADAPNWVSLINTERVRFVSPDGVDDNTDPLRGIDPNRPWKTIRYACEQIEDEDQDEHTTIEVGVGIYRETLPIVVPAKTAIVGAEVRSTIVEPAPAVAALAGDADYTRAALQRLSNILSSVIVGTPVIVTAGNTVEQNYEALSLQPRADEVRSMIASMRAYIDYHLNGNGTNPAVTGSNTKRTTDDVLDAVLCLLNNKEFLAAEAAAYIAFTYPTYDFDSELCKRDIRRYVDAWCYDLQYLGNYRSIRAAQAYRNAVQGSEGQDMFYVRNATGVRNMTLQGLTGTLPTTPQGIETWFRPTGGAYVSLDPGWGPDDEKVWITTRSCYVQNVTTFGYAAIGQKVDGNLHNGGNKSITSNDFTQLISDGIGAYILNGGRAELVSVFTYYSQIGYFAENGGIIRATNGNNSYGKIGALAIGVNPDETPLTATVNGRTEQASVASAFAGEFSDEIFAFEFDNAGQEYTEASYTVVGAGINLNVVQEEFRDDAVHQIRLTTPDSSNPGGAGYSQIGNNAQTGDSLSITIASNDTNTREDLLGLRIIITAGPGTGQYGYVYDYNAGSKYLTVYKESDNTPGWDHISPNYPITNLLTTATVYRLEPRPIVDHPGFLALEYTLPSTGDWQNVIFGETSGQFNNLAGTIGLGSVVEVDGLVPVTARWNVTKNGREYDVELINPGAGYADEQEVRIRGSLLGGADDLNDLIITVKSVSDDSTNSITSFEWTGEASSGVFVVTGTGTSIAYYSPTGQTWTASVLPGLGRWDVLGSGNGKFITLRYGTNQAAISSTGTTWTTRTMPGARDWTDICYADGVWLAVAEDTNLAAYSTDDGTTWSNVTLPNPGDSSFINWQAIAYGKGTFVVVSGTGNYVANGTYDSFTDNWTWDFHIMDVIADSSLKDWIGVAYGNGRFVAISATGDLGYSFDGEFWYPGTMPSQDGSTAHNWRQIRYAQGVFFAVGDTGGRNIGGDPTLIETTYCATSENGVQWTGRALDSEEQWTAIAFGNPRVEGGDSSIAFKSGRWVAVAENTTNTVNVIFTGARAKARVVANAGVISAVRIIDPGSGYLIPPTITFVDPNNTTEATADCRLADGVLGPPTFINRGFGWRSSSTTVTVSGDGFADNFVTGRFITLDNLSRTPALGSQIRFAGNSGIYSVSVIENDEQINGGIRATLRIKPVLDTQDNLAHGTAVEIREQYSQVRMTGHDFLDIGTGNFVQTNYPEIYNTGQFTVAPEDEIVEVDGGRVFYTSTDQIGNFRCGELFAVEQATAIVTISADFFDLSGLSELRLGGIRLGGSGTVIREFSTDTLFSQDSNNVVPTQRAIKAYLNNRLTIGGSELLTASFVAGQIKIGPNEIKNVIGGNIIFPNVLSFGPEAEISGSWVAMDYFYGSFKDSTNMNNTGIG